ncbi:MAG: hypothetical protein RIR70_2048, partial [Pseudomonadota bacterium]
VSVFRIHGMTHAAPVEKRAKAPARSAAPIITPAASAPARAKPKALAPLKEAPSSAAGDWESF